MIKKLFAITHIEYLDPDADIVETVTRTEYVEAETAVAALDTIQLGTRTLLRAVEVTDAEIVCPTEPKWTTAGTMRGGQIDLDALYAEAEAKGWIPWKDAAS